LKLEESLRLPASGGHQAHQYPNSEHNRSAKSSRKPEQSGDIILFAPLRHAASEDCKPHPIHFVRIDYLKNAGYTCYMIGNTHRLIAGADTRYLMLRLALAVVTALFMLSGNDAHIETQVHTEHTMPRTPEHTGDTHHLVARVPAAAANASDRTPGKSTWRLTCHHPVTVSPRPAQDRALLSPGTNMLPSLRTVVLIA
jgi:hypothetical protein